MKLDGSPVQVSGSTKMGESTLPGIRMLIPLRPHPSQTKIDSSWGPDTADVHNHAQGRQGVFLPLCSDFYSPIAISLFFLALYLISIGDAEEL